MPSLSSSSTPNPTGGLLLRTLSLFAITGTVLALALAPRNWPATIRDVLARQILFTAIEATGFILLIAFCVALAIAAQFRFVTGVATSELLGPVFVFVVIREVGPLLINLVVIGRSGNAMAAELATMTINGEVRALDALGLDPLAYLVLPRVIGWIASVFCLTVVFIGGTLFFGFITGSLIGARVGTPLAYADSIVSAVRPIDAFALLAKILIPATLGSVIACQQGLSVERSSVEVPRATSRTMQRSLVMLFLVNGLITVLSYIPGGLG